MQRPAGQKYLNPVGSPVKVRQIKKKSSDWFLIASYKLPKYARIPKTDSLVPNQGKYSSPSLHATKRFNQAD